MLRNQLSATLGNAPCGQLCTRRVANRGRISCALESLVALGAVANEHDLRADVPVRLLVSCQPNNYHLKTYLVFEVVFCFPNISISIYSFFPKTSPFFRHQSFDSFYFCWPESRPRDKLPLVVWLCCDGVEERWSLAAANHKRRLSGAAANNNWLSSY